MGSIYKQKGEVICLVTILALTAVAKQRMLLVATGFRFTCALSATAFFAKRTHQTIAHNVGVTTRPRVYIVCTPEGVTRLI